VDALDEDAGLKPHTYAGPRSPRPTLRTKQRREGVGHPGRNPGGTGLKAGHDKCWKRAAQSIPYKGGGRAKGCGAKAPHLHRRTTKEAKWRIYIVGVLSGDGRRGR
jgi:hypothetical protein